jgi:hypothetical protein
LYFVGLSVEIRAIVVELGVFHFLALFIILGYFEALIVVPFRLPPDLFVIKVRQ